MHPLTESASRATLRARQVTLLLAACTVLLALAGCQSQQPSPGPENDAAAAANLPGGNGPANTGASGPNDAAAAANLPK